MLDNDPSLFDCVTGSVKDQLQEKMTSFSEEFLPLLNPVFMRSVVLIPSNHSRSQFHSVH